MLKTLLLATSLAICGSAWANDAPAAKDTTAAQKAAAVKKQAARAEARSRSCLRSTGTRIVLKNQQCVASPGRVYSQDDLQRTGATTVNEALRLLDTAF
jgi:hypothetical protein